MKFWNNKPTKLPEVHRPMDWQDRVVLWGCAVCGTASLAILVWGK